MLSSVLLGQASGNITLAGTKIWAYNASGPVQSSPLISKDDLTMDELFIGSADGRLHALDTDYGSIRWRFQTGGEVLSTPKRDANTVYFGSVDGNLYAVHATLYWVNGSYHTAGTKRWAFMTGGPVVSSPALPPKRNWYDGAAMVYAGSDDGHLYAINGSNGSAQWSFRTHGRVQSSPLVSADGNMVFVGSDDGYLYAINAGSTSQGTEIWSFRTSGKVYSSPAMSRDGSTVFVGSDDGYLYAVFANNGTVRWAFGTGNKVHSSPAVSGDGAKVFVGSDDHHLYAVHASNGTLFWAFKTGDRVRSSPMVARDDVPVCVGSDDRHLYCVHPANGTQAWTFATGGRVLSSPKLMPTPWDGSNPEDRDAGGAIIVGSEDGRIYSFVAMTHHTPKVLYLCSDDDTCYESGEGTMLWSECDKACWGLRSTVFQI